VNMEMRYRLLGAGSVRLDQINPSGNSAWLTAQAALLAERETAASVSSLMSKSVG
jgi:hypothetical protein